MSGPVLLDAGPWVAMLDRRQAEHAWAKRVAAEVTPPFVSCEAVLSETCFLLKRSPAAGLGALEMVLRGAVLLTFRLQDHIDAIARLMRKYANLPMSLADACIVRMSELHPESPVLTLDSDLRTYRKNGRQLIPTIMPDQYGTHLK